MAYTKTVYVNGESPAISAGNLNNSETGIDEAHDAIENTTTGHHHDGVGSRRVYHFGDDTNYSEFETDGKLHFTGDARPIKFAVFSSCLLCPAHHAPLEITEINGIASSITVGASNKIDIIGYDGGVNVKGRLKNVTFSAVDTTTPSSITKIRLSADAPAGWSNASQWQVTLSIVGGCITGDFTVFMPPFNLESGDRMEGYITNDGAVYLERGRGAFDVSVAGSEYVSQNMSNNESSGSNVVIEIADTTGFYIGNLVNVVDDADSEVSRIIAVNAGTSITVDTLTNSYTTAANAKVEIVEYTKTVPVCSVQRGLLRMPMLNTGINSGVVLEYGIPHTIDTTEDIGIVLHYMTDADNGAGQDVRFRVQYMIEERGVYIPKSNQYGTQILTTWTPPASRKNDIVALGTISATDHAGKHILSIRIIRDGADAIDTYAGDVGIVAIVLNYYDKQLGFEA